MNGGRPMTPAEAAALVNLARAKQPRPEPAPFMWCFDRGVESLVYLDREMKRGVVWKRPVWEAAGFTIDALRLLPPMPRELHDRLAG